MSTSRDPGLRADPRKLRAFLRRRAWLAVVVACAAVLAAAGVIATTTLSHPAPAGPQLHVSGNRLVSATGQRVVLHGANRSGGEYSCVHGRGFWDGPMNQASAAR